MSDLTKSKAIFYLAAVFLAGAAAGTFAGYTSGKQKSLRPPPEEEMVAHLSARLQNKLELSAEQMKKIKPLVEQSCAEMQAVHRDSWKCVSQTYQKLNQLIARHLTPEQQLKLNEMERERQDWVTKKCRPRSSGDSGPSQPDSKPRK